MNPPRTYYIGDSVVSPATESWEEIERDPRGVLLLWEEPVKKARYIMGMDSSEGVTGWTRGMRRDGDHKIDNGVVEVFRVDGAKEPAWKEDVEGNRTPDLDANGDQRWRYRDVQVAEFAAPCDAVEIARVADVVGRLFAGDAGDQCELIWEGWPGCGMLATQELLRLGYGNLWHWEYITDVAEDSGRLGWRSSYESLKMLWYRARRHLMQENVIIRSKFLKSEYASAEVDLQKMRARAAYGSHDDRFMASNLCFWAGHKWTYDPERSWEEVTAAPKVVDFQRAAPGFDEDGKMDEILTFADWKRRVVEDWDV